MKFRSLLKGFKAFLTESERRDEEKKLLQSISALRKRKKVLEDAAQSGGPVKDEFEKVNKDLHGMLDTFPRGNWYAFTKFFLLCVILYIILYKFINLVYTEIILDMGLWGPIETWHTNWYLLKYRPISWRTFKIGYLLTSWNWVLLIPVVSLLLLWVVQGMLFRSHARLLLQYSSVIVFLLWIFLFFSSFGILIGPLITKM